jgi:hypothetical protein
VLSRYDADVHRFDGRGISVELPFFAPQVALVDPALAGGLIGLALRDDVDGIQIAELHGDDLAAATTHPLKARRLVRVPGDLLATDRAGRVYATLGHDVGIYERGAQVGVLRGAAQLALRPSPDGKHVAAFGRGRLVAFSSVGTQLWETAAWEASDVGWTPGGELFARFFGALAKIDLATGALRERQCGWVFMVASSAHDTAASAPSVCDAL